MTQSKTKLTVVFFFIMVLNRHLSYSQLFDTLISLTFTQGTCRIHDIYISDNQCIMLYDHEKELFVYNSSDRENPFFLKARLSSEKGDRYKTSNSYQVKQPRLCNEGKLVVAASDLDQDGLGGRFLRWDVQKQKQLDDIITGQWGIGKWAVSSDGRYYVNYFLTKPGKKIPVIDAMTNKTMHIKTKYILYSDSIFFTDDNRYLVFLSALDGQSFKNKVFRFPELTIENTSYTFSKSNSLKADNVSYSIENDSLIITSGENIQKIYMEGKSFLWQNKNDGKIYLAISNKNKLKVIAIKGQKN